MRVWQEMEEAGGALGVEMLSALVRILPHPILVLIAIPVSLFYYATSAQARAAIKLYASHIEKATGRKISAWKCFFAFSITVIEKCESWVGKINVNRLDIQGDAEVLHDLLKNGKGVFLIVSHLGNSEELRALSDELSVMGLNRKIPILSIMDIDVAGRFNKALKGLNASSSFNILNVRKITMESIEEIESVIERGGIVVVAGDRAADRNIMVPFLGEAAPFPLGAFSLPAMMSAPSFFAVCVRKKDISLKKEYAVFVKTSCSNWDGMTRKERKAKVEKTCLDYVRFLEAALLRHPYQWFNFYDFWRSSI